MTFTQAKNLKTGTFIEFAGSEYEFAGLYPTGHILRKIHLRIFDEPGTIHKDSVLIKDCKLKTK